MKTIYKSADGSVAITESGGVFTLTLTESLGGGQSAGLVKGNASILLDAATALKLGETLINSHLSAAMQPLAVVVEGVVNQVVATLE